MLARYYPRVRSALQALECVLTNFEKSVRLTDKNVWRGIGAVSRPIAGTSHRDYHRTSCGS